MASHSIRPQQASHWHLLWAFGVACAAAGVGHSDAVFLGDGGCSASRAAAVTLVVVTAATSSSSTIHEHSDHRTTVHELLPRFVEPIENHTAVQGRDVSFTCIVDHIGTYVVAWIKADSKAVLAMHNRMVTQSNRVSLTHNGHNAWTLRVANVHQSDEGEYMCQINTEPMIYQSGVLKVVVPPDILNDGDTGFGMGDGSSGSMPPEAPEGGKVKLQCLATGDPEPVVSWRREDGQNIVLRNEGGRDKMTVKTVEGGTLHLLNVQRQDMGVYLCIASNGVPPSVSKRFLVNVKFEPLIKVSNQLVAAPVRSDVVIQCTVESWPKAMNTWWREIGKRRDRIEITPSSKYSITEEVISEYSLLMNLTIRDLNLNDFGGYICSSQNTLGQAEGLVRLQELHLAETTTLPPPTTTVTSPTRHNGHDHNKHRPRKKTSNHSKDNGEGKRKRPEGVVLDEENALSPVPMTVPTSTPPPVFPTRSTQWRLNGAEQSSKAVRSPSIQFTAIFLSLVVALTETGVRWL